MDDMISPSDLSDNHLKGALLLVLACCGYVSKQSLAILNDSPQYIRKTLADMKRKKLIVVSDSGSKDIRLGIEGVELLKYKNRQVYNYYMRMSNKNHLGRTENHREAATKSAEVIMQMIQAGVKVGPQKPVLSDVLADYSKQMDIDNAAFFLNKELRYSDDQKESRVNISRISGILFSFGICATVYNCQRYNIELMMSPEKQANVRIARQAKDLFGEEAANKHIRVELKQSIIIFSNDEMAVRALNRKTKTCKSIIPIANAVENPNILESEFYYIPYNTNGIKSLELLTFFTEEEICEWLFTAEEIKLAKVAKMGDAIAYEKVHYEFVSCNITKMARVRRKFGSSGFVIICRRYQFEFLRQYFASDLVELNEVKESWIEELISYRKPKEREEEIDEQL